ncbi:Protein CBG14206 [Caenorhabditis briggsae]|uniref:Protein CBG14206 n=1 Tax=Caenorhabditis briggsae TaxID=6238 RepID=A8XJI5_CAEBR|nr:Protein CBG14206 [Caenorhabditis briggsae]CAP32810.2 Protein CBG14206 [Caenorhabditis briggsae]
MRISTSIFALCRVCNHQVQSPKPLETQTRVAQACMQMTQELEHWRETVYRKRKKFYDYLIFEISELPELRFSFRTSLQCTPRGVSDAKMKLSKLNTTDISIPSRTQHELHMCSRNRPSLCERWCISIHLLEYVHFPMCTGNKERCTKVFASLKKDSASNSNYSKIIFQWIQVKRNWNPVCDKKGQTHANFCTFLNSKCYHKNQLNETLEVDYSGVCCEDMCSAGQTTLTVCDSEGKTHTDICSFYVAKCRQIRRGTGKKRLQIAGVGPCKPKNPLFRSFDYFVNRSVNYRQSKANRV